MKEILLGGALGLAIGASVFNVWQSIQIDLLEQKLEVQKTRVDILILTVKEACNEEHDN